jgi:thiol-disulfide isomerase/thioredoxin
MKPLLAMVYMQGCSACEEVKPHFRAFAEKHPQVLQYAMMDLDKAKLSFPVEYTPTLVLKLPRGMYKTDPVAFGKDFTSASIGEWVSNALRDYRARGL